ncbi:hypothetical protein FA13DRAFT_1735573 [Coprinellus micaceus]|uniref:Uncharacterized protein n=1 Tax=Coprinellus micaceus TaxID=71717 RepID=A0A4Y7T335_COPMI|nr:hypothetical protein FA13DRAFT_1735573 [Coprinellus micaceus]
MPPPRRPKQCSILAGISGGSTNRRGRVTETHYPIFLCQAAANRGNLTDFAVTSVTWTPSFSRHKSAVLQLTVPGVGYDPDRPFHCT